MRVRGHRGVDARSRLITAGFAVRRGLIIVAGLLITITANGDTSEVTISDTDVVSGPNEVMLEFPLKRGGDTGFDAFIPFRTEDNTATAGTDYSATSGIVRLPAGEAGASIPVAVSPNPVSGPNLDFRMVLDMRPASD